MGLILWRGTVNPGLEKGKRVTTGGIGRSEAGEVTEMFSIKYH
jgi:hypothetical protein